MLARLFLVILLVACAAPTKAFSLASGNGTTDPEVLAAIVPSENWVPAKVVPGPTTGRYQVSRDGSLVALPIRFTPSLTDTPEISAAAAAAVAPSYTDPIGAWPTRLVSPSCMTTGTTKSDICIFSASQ